MAEVYQTLTELEDIFQPLVVSLLGWNDLSPDVSNNVRISWIRTGMPAMDINTNYVYLRVTELDNPYNKQREFTYVTNADDLTKRTEYTRVISLNCILYGSDSFDNAQLLRDGMFSDSAMFTLKDSGLYHIPDVASPKRTPELFQGQWWERTDVEFKFNELIIRESDMNAIDSAVTYIDRENGDIETIIVVE